MKKLLALVLALVMTLGLATVGTNAALSDFSDADQVSNEEAMAVMNAVGVFVGSDGKLDPKGGLTRAAAAKLVAYLALGEDIAEALPKTGSKFADVPDGAWYTGYVNYMVNEGYTTGTGANTFSPDGQLNGYQFGAFLLAVLGYDRNLEGMVGSGWETKVAVKLEELGLTKNVDKLGSANLTREEAAQFCLNALKADCVEYSDKGTSIDINGAKITTGAKAATKVAAAYTTNDNNKIDNVKYNNANDHFVQLAEKLYKGDLKLKTAEVTDKFGRVAHEWYWKGTTSKYKVGTYAGSADYTHVVTSTSKTGNVLAVADALGVDTASARKAAFKAQAVALGQTVELYTNDDDLAVSFIIFQTTLAQVTKLTANSNGDYAYTVTLKDGNGSKTYKDTDLAGFDAATMTKDTYVTVTKAVAPEADGIAVAVADKVTGKVTGYGSNAITIDGTKHSANNDNLWDVSATFGDDNTNTYDVYLDANGFIIGAEKVTDENTIENVFYVKDSQFAAGSTFSNAKAKLEVYYLDGKTEVVDMVITTKDGDKVVNIGGTKTALSTDDLSTTVKGHFYAYTLDGNKVSKITLIENANVKNASEVVTGTPAITFTAKKPTVTVGDKTYYASSSTKIVTIDEDGKIATVTGYSTLPTKTYTRGTNAYGALVIADKTSLKEIYVVGVNSRIGAVETAVYGYFVEKGDTVYKDADTGYVTTLVFNVAGKNTDYQIKTDDLAEDYEGLYRLEVVDGYVDVDDTVLGDDSTAMIPFVRVDSVKDGYVVVNETVVKLANNCPIYDATNAKKIADGALNDGDIVCATLSGIDNMEELADATVTSIYIAYAEPSDGVFAAEKSDAFVAYLLQNDVATAEALNGEAAATFAALKDDGRVVKFALDKDYSSKALAVTTTRTDIDGQTPANVTTASTVTGNKGDTVLVLIDVHSYDVGDYDVTVKIDNATVVTYSFSVGA